MVKLDFNPTTLLIKQYIKWIPFKLGLINKGAFIMQINEIKADDLFLLSYPKSGNTWLRFILATALKGRSDFSFNELEDIVPDVYISKNKINSMVGPRIIKTHDPVFNDLPACIYIYRDYRDVLVSYYHYTLNTNEFKGTLKEFIRSNFSTKAFGSWVNHVSLAFEAKQKNKKILLVKYEDLLANSAQEVDRIIEFSGIKTNLDSQSIANLCNFTKLRENEKSKGSYFGNEALFFRKGISTNGKSGLDEDDLTFIFEDKKLVELMKKLNYLK